MFDGVGKLKGYQYGVPPPMQEPLKKDLDWMVALMSSRNKKRQDHG